MIKFGPSGTGERFFSEGYKTTVQSAQWVKSNNLDCFEYSFGMGVNLRSETAQIIGNAFNNANVSISVHAPYYISFASAEEEKVEKSFGYLLNSARIGSKMGAKRVIFHAASQGKSTREAAFEKTIDNLKIFADLAYKNGYENMLFCPETMGRTAQIGTIKEVTEFCLIDKIFIPTVDFGHVNALEQGSLKTKNDYKIRLEYMLEKLGREKMQNFHIHFSKIQYGSKGEVRHLTFSDDKYGPEPEPLLEALIELNLEPTIICESAGTQADDAIYMKQKYNEFLRRKDGGAFKS